MIKKFSKFFWTALLIYSVMSSSCASSRKVAYFNNLQDTTLVNNFKVPVPFIQKNDILSITVTSLNPEASVIFNAPNYNNVNTSSIASTTSVGNAGQASGYLVDFNGDIQFPVLGNIHVDSLTDEQLKDSLTNELKQKKLLVDPIVNVRHLNFRVTVLGEVAHPAVINVNSDKISILEAIGLAGDLTIYGKRNNVLLIREIGGEKVIRRIDLTSPKLLTSQYFYLKTNDVVYVEPNKNKLYSTSNARQLLPVIISLASVITLALYRLK